VRISLRMVVIVLAILTIAMAGATVYAYVDSLREPRSGILIQADEVEADDVPSYATVITDPHPYLIEAVENPGDKIYVGAGLPQEEVEAVCEQVGFPENLGATYVEYEGKYYGILVLEVLPGLEPPIQYQEALGFSALAVCWVVVGYSYHRKKKETTRHEKG